MNVKINLSSAELISLNTSLQGLIYGNATVI